MFYWKATSLTSVFSARMQISTSPKMSNYSCNTLLFCSYHSWWWLDQQWWQHSQMLLEGNQGSPLHLACAFAHKSANQIVTFQSSLRSGCAQGVTKRFICFVFNSYWYQHDAVVCPTELSDAVQKNSRHLLVPVFHKTKHLEGKASQLTLPILENCSLWVFMAAV